MSCRYPKTEEDKKTLLFDGDEENGGCRVICGFCDFMFNDKDLEVCPNCGYDLVYPPGCDW